MENQRTTFDSFIGLSSCSKTLRNELRPSVFTKKHLEEHGIIAEDEFRAEKREELKGLMDAFYRSFIEDVLSQMETLDFKPLFSVMMEYKKERSDKCGKKLEKIQQDLRKQIHSQISNRDEYKKMFSRDMLTNLLPNYLEKHAGTDEQVETVKVFAKFTTAFKNYFETRKNVFSEEDIPTSICHRIVNENAVIFYENIQSYSNICKDAGGQIAQMEKDHVEILSGRTLAEIFSEHYYSGVMLQKDIDFYNLVCGVVNKYMNLFCQQRKVSRARYRMRTLHKQILCESQSAFEIPRMYENDEEVYASINEFTQNLKDKDILGRLQALGSNVSEYDLGRVYINAKNFSQISQFISGRWNLIEQCQIEAFSRKSKKKDENKLQKAIKKVKQYSLQELLELINDYGQENVQKETRKVADYVSEIYVRSSTVELKEFIADSDSHLVTDQTKAAEVKTYLDSLMALYHLLGAFKVDEFVDKDERFYMDFEEAYDEMKELVSLYNRVRNYVTQKPFSQKKIKLYFGNPQLANGWSESKEFDYNTMILVRDNKYYLAIFNAKKKPPKDIIAGKSQRGNESDYMKIVYNLLEGAYKTLPKIYIKTKKWEKEHGIPEHIKEGYAKEKYKKGSPNFDMQFCRELIDYLKSCISLYPNYKCFHFHFSDTATYNDISEFYREVDQQGYKIGETYISESDIEQLDRDGRIYLFQIYNKDFSNMSYGTANLHTMYLKNLFSEENLKDMVLQLNGGAELFFRKSSIKEPVIHKEGTILVNKTYEENGIIRSIPESCYHELYEYFNDNGDGTLSEEAQKWKEKVSTKQAAFDMVKDYRYSVDKFFLHMPITINYRAKQANKVNELVWRYIKDNQDMHIIGIDRGERNLLYVSLIDSHGKIIKQKSLNTIKMQDGDRDREYDYKSRLADKEIERDSARKNWQEISKIKDIKEGYLSNVISEICQMVLEKHAIIVMEDLSYGFKRGRFKVERQVYQKFETMLIKKLNYLVDKKKPVDAPGGLLRGYQLTYVPDKLGETVRQNGIIFYVPAGYTSKIDPTTGFVNIFNFTKITSFEARKGFINNMDSIRYDAERGLFAITFDYNNFATHNTTLARTDWTIYVCGERIKKSKTAYGWQGKPVHIEKNIKELLTEAGIGYEDGHNVLEDIGKLDEKTERPVVNELFEIIRLTVQLRNSTTEKRDSEEAAWDRIISPVLNDQGEFFDTEDFNGKECAVLPVDADANGAYCIGLKGLFVTRKIRDNWRPGEKLGKNLLKISHADWFDFIQNRRF